MVTLEEMKNYLRVDYEDDDALIQGMITAAVRQCMDILRTDREEDLIAAQNGKIAVMFTTAYLYAPLPYCRPKALHTSKDLYCVSLPSSARSCAAELYVCNL